MKIKKIEVGVGGGRNNNTEINKIVEGGWKGGGRGVGEDRINKTRSLVMHKSA